MSLSPENLFAAIGRRRRHAVLREGRLCLDGATVLEVVRARATRLRRLGCRRVALALDNGIDWALWDLALLRAGLVSVPLPAFFSALQCLHALDAAGVDCVIGKGIPAVHAAGFVSEDGLIAQRVPTVAPPLHDGTAKITFTSGTTGRPKGVCLDAGAQLAVADSLRAVTAGAGVQRHLVALPLAVLLENIAGLYAPLLAEAEVDLAPLAQVGLSGSSSFDARRLLDVLHARQPHSVILVPQSLHAMVEALERGGRRPDSLRFVAVGGARVAPALLRRVEALGLPVFEGYGLSECSSVVSLNLPGARRTGSVGRPLPACEVRIAADGEVLVRGPRMLGYLGEPAARDDWLATGDLGRFDDDGLLVVHGRKKHQYATAWGRNVSPEWVEAELSAQPAIAQAWLHGEALPHNVAVLVPRSPDIDDAVLAAAVAAVNRSLPDYLRAHRWLRATEAFTPANGLATANGRLCREALMAHYRGAISPSPSLAQTQGASA